MFYVMEMPVNEDGDGPEMEKEKVFQTLWEIWDENCVVVCTLMSQHRANEVCNDLNHYWGSMNGR